MRSQPTSGRMSWMTHWLQKNVGFFFPHLFCLRDGKQQHGELVKDAKEKVFYCIWTQDPGGTSAPLVALGPNSHCHLCMEPI